jgi:hypothetical protein
VSWPSTSNAADLSAGGVDPSHLNLDNLDDIMTTVDTTGLRRIFHHQIAESEDPDAMRHFLEMLLPPPAGR